MLCSMNAPVMVELSGETDALEVSVLLMQFTRCKRVSQYD